MKRFFRISIILLVYLTVLSMVCLPIAFLAYNRLGSPQQNGINGLIDAIQEVIPLSSGLKGTSYVKQLAFFEQKAFAADGASLEDFGISVAVLGNTALIGADCATIDGNANQGAAYVFVYDGSSWSFQQKLVAADGAGDDYFGVSVALGTDIALVGASGTTIGEKTAQGAAYIFTREGTKWTQQAKLIADDGETGDDFGWSVALSDGTAVVGANSKTINDARAQGAAYVFIAEGPNWVQQARLTALDGAEDDWFGWSVALSGNTVLVGTPKSDVLENIDQGAVYTFTRADGNWTEQSKLTAPDGEAYDGFGWSVAVSGDTAMVGAIYDEIGDNSWQGSAYVFTRSDNQWDYDQILTASDGMANDQFGFSISLSGNNALIGVNNATIGNNSNQGAAYLFSLSDSIWLQQAKLASSDGIESDNFGVSVSYSGDTSLVGANGAMIGDNSSQGAAYFYSTGEIKPKLIVINQVVNENGGTKNVSDFTINVTGNAPEPASFTGVGSPGTIISLNIGNYSVSETGLSGYYATYSADCSGTILLGETRTCTVTNHDGAAHLSLINQVSNNDGGGAEPTEWTLTGDGPTQLSGAGRVEGDVSPGTYTISESGGAEGYTSGEWTCVGGSQSGNQITLDAGASASCTITNDDIQPKLTVTMIVNNDYSGALTPDDFSLYVDIAQVTSGEQNGFAAGTHTVGEGALPVGYEQVSITGDCASDGSITLKPGDVKSCTITNQDLPVPEKYKVFLPFIMR